MSDNQPANRPATADRAQSRSTGPRTEPGKAISSQNARKHDLCSRTLRLSPVEWDEYNDMAACYRCDLQPVDDVEHTLIDEICFNYWRLQQAREVELDIMAKHPTELPIIALYIRYRTGYERAFYKALDQIQKRQRERRRQATQDQAALRSAKREHPAAPPSEVCSADSAARQMQALTSQLDIHIGKNQVRSEKCLDPVPLPQTLADGLDEFVSKNPGVLPLQLLDILKKVA